jgi:hypothetical protein
MRKMRGTKFYDGCSIQSDGSETFYDLSKINWTEVLTGV